MAASRSSGPNGLRITGYDETSSAVANTILVLGNSTDTMLAKFQPAHSRHFDVGDQHVDPAVAQIHQFQRHLPVGGSQHGQARALQEMTDRRAEKRVCLHHQYAGDADIGLAQASADPIQADLAGFITDAARLLDGGFHFGPKSQDWPRIENAVSGN